MHAAAPPTVWVVDDDSSLRQSLSEWLREQGYRVYSAGNGRDALRLLADRGQPRLILLDLNMPVLSGWEFLRLRAQVPQLRSIPVVVLSGVCNFEGISDLGIAACFRKPLDLESLLDVIRDTCPDGRGGPSP